MPRKKRNKTRFVPTLILLTIIVFSIFFVLKFYEKNAYPTTYSEYVEKYSAQYAIDKYFIYAIIKTESGFNPKAVSEDEAYGLMQFTPATFDWIKGKLGTHPEQVHSDLFNPETSIEYGCYLVWYLLDEFGSEREALAAYHAGRTAVNGWLTNPEYSSDGRTLTTTPYRDTNHYIAKVMQNYNKYKQLYE